MVLLPPRRQNCRRRLPGGGSCLVRPPAQLALLDPPLEIPLRLPHTHKQKVSGFGAAVGRRVGGLDTDKWEFVDSPGLVYHFPRSIDCEVIYCNIEGVTFLEGNRIMTTSDASKSAQSYNCVEKAQSVQVNPPRGTTSLRDAPDPALC